MNLTDMMTGVPVSLSELSRDRKAQSLRIQTLLASAKGACLLRFSLNIAGPVKSFPLALDAFDEGLKEIRAGLPEPSLLAFEETRESTGPNAFFLLDAPPEHIKKIAASIEESHPLGRLFNLDVYRPDGKTLTRSHLSLPVRPCLICGGDATLCRRKNRHSTELLLWASCRLLNDFFRNQAADMAASCAVRALLYEVSSTPKPGLVDRNNSGSHKDMDFFTFLDSSAALIPWFRDFFCIGWDYGDEPNHRLFSRLRFAGQKAEAGMFAATGGVNTHKGLIFSSAILCGALGKAHASKHRPLSSQEVLSVCKRLGQCSLGDFQAASSRTAGERCHKEYGLPGARGEAAAGFPSALKLGLPSLKSRLAEGYSLNDAAVLTLLALLSSMDDTNMIHRGGRALALECKKEAEKLLSEITRETFRETLSKLDLSYMEKNLSPGGCADLLAVSLMLYFLESCGLVACFSPEI